MDLAQDFHDSLAHLVAMWRKGGFREHAEWRARQMARDYPEQYRGMPEALEQAANELRAQKAARLEKEEAGER